MSRITSFFFWLAGADSALLDRCPASERIKFAAVGASVLVPTVTGFGSMLFYAGKHLSNPLAITVIATVWAFFILTIDRLLLTTYRPFSSFWKKRLWQILLRVILALFISAAIAHPICLHQFGGAIKRRFQKHVNSEIKQRTQDRITQEEDIRKQSAALINPAEAELNGLRSQRDLDASELDADVQKKVNLRAAKPRELAGHQTREEALQNDLDQLNKKLGDEQVEKGKVDQAIYDEMTFGTNKYTPDGAVKKKPGKEFSEKERHNMEKCPRMATLYNRQEELTKVIGEDSAKKINVAQELEQEQKSVLDGEAKAQEDRAAVEAGARVEVQNEIKHAGDERATRISDLTNRLEELRKQEAEKRQAVDKSATQILDDLNARYDQGLDPMEETVTLADVIMKPDDATEGSTVRQAAGLFQFVLTFGIFLLVDLIPILAKMMSAGPYDELVHRTEQELRTEHDARVSLTGPFIRRRVLDSIGAQTRQHLEAIHAQDGELARMNGRPRATRPPPDLSFEQR